jgi:N-acetylneuraminic acid mutarotase
MRTRKFCLRPGQLCGLLLAFATISSSVWALTSGTNQWSWMGGSSTTNQAGVYGTLGTPSGANIPGSRWYASQWTDKNGNFWVFGGDGYDSLGQEDALNDLWVYSPQTNEWTWMGGNSTLPCTSFGQCSAYPGVYGTLGMPAAGNAPGSRIAATSWTDLKGNLWLFGGDGADSVGIKDNGWLNDLWEYNTSTNEWTWMSGSSTVTCSTPGLGDFCGAPGQYSGTLATYTSGNVPAGRFGAMGWADNGGNLWLFGGMTMVEAGVDTYLNDLWEFDRDSNQWIWMGGSAAVPCPTGVACSGVPGVYGTLGSPSSRNIPGAREFSATWVDSQGNFWLFGGQGMVANGGNYLNDLWEFNPATNEWTWMGGSDTLYKNGGAPGVYGTMGTPAAANIPGARQYASSWTDANGNLWLFGGQGFDANGAMGNLNDLWEFSPTLKQWVWVSGSDTAGGIGVYEKGAHNKLQVVAAKNSPGSFGVSSHDARPDTYSTMTTPGTADTPGSRMNAMSWTDKSGNLWLFAGSNGSQSFLNDLWTFQPSEATFPVADFSVAATPASTAVTAGQNGTASISVSPSNGFNSAVSFSCSGLPSGATCSFLPQTVTPSGSAASTTLTVTTTSSMAAIHQIAGPLFPISALAALACCVGWKRRRLLQFLGLIVVGVIGLSVFNGCGGGSSGGGTPPPQSATYTITVNATSGSLVHSTTFMLTVN